MAVYIGGTGIGSVYIGSTKADSVYIGETKVWPTLPPWWPDEWEYINSTGNFEAQGQAQDIATQRGLDPEEVSSLDFGFDLENSTHADWMLAEWLQLEQVAIRNTSNVTEMTYKIGRASCRDRVRNTGGAVARKGGKRWRR